mgnify:CR=1 FL=1
MLQLNAESPDHALAILRDFRLGISPDGRQIAYTAVVCGYYYYYYPQTTGTEGAPAKPRPKAVAAGKK